MSREQLILRRMNEECIGIGKSTVPTVKSPRLWGDFSPREVTLMKALGIPYFMFNRMFVVPNKYYSLDRLPSNPRERLRYL